MSTFTNNLNQKLEYILTINNPASRNITIFVHGNLSHKNFSFFPQVCKSLPYNTFRFDISGSGNSEGEHRISGFEQDVNDIRSAVLFLKNQGYNVFALAGHSKGAMDIVKYCYMYNDVKYIIWISGRSLPETAFGDNTDVREQLQVKPVAEFKLGKIIGRISREELQEFIDFPMKEIIERIDVRALIMQGTADKVVPPDQLQVIREMLGDRVL